MRGSIITYLDMCRIENSSLQRGMNFRLRGRHSIFLMSTRPTAPYRDRIEDEGTTLIYEGHDSARSAAVPSVADKLNVEVVTLKKLALNSSLMPTKHARNYATYCAKQKKFPNSQKRTNRVRHGDGRDSPALKEARTALVTKE